ncbi:MAG: hypothetical protein RQ723_00900 [Desulfuromonadales bacterium]|nr:hypothetical protein [Desulfuromonadales bacterium]
MIRLLLWLLFGFLAYRLFRYCKQSLHGSAPPSRATDNGEEMVHDPQCGSYLPRSTALQDRIDGQTRFFCSENCRQHYRQTHTKQGDRS